MNLDLKINDQPLQLGAPVTAADLAAAGFRKTGFLQRLLQKLPAGVQRFEADNCTFSCFGATLQIYPCTDGYLTPDRQWRTEAVALAQDDRLHGLEIKIREGQYSATNFSEQFHEICTAQLGEPVESDRFFTLWRCQGMLVANEVHPDRMNADISISLDNEA